MGVITPKVKVIAGVVVGLETEPEIPLAVTTEIFETVPDALAEVNKAWVTHSSTQQKVRRRAQSTHKFKIGHLLDIRLQVSAPSAAG